MDTVKFDNVMLEACEVFAKLSKDESTKLGAVIVGPDFEILSVGWNGFPRGINDNDGSRQIRPLKYEFMIHAEENAILNAARIGVSLKGATLYVPGRPCSRCAGMIIQVGIKRVVIGSFQLRSEWAVSCGIGMAKMAEAGLSIDGKRQFFKDKLTVDDKMVDGVYRHLEKMKKAGEGSKQ